MLDERSIGVRRSVLEDEIHVMAPRAHLHADLLHDRDVEVVEHADDEALGASRAGGVVVRLGVQEDLEPVVGAVGHALHRRPVNVWFIYLIHKMK